MSSLNDACKLHAVSAGRFLGGVGQNGKRRFVFPGEARVVFDRVYARHEVDDVVVANFFVTVTQRFAFDGSAAGKGFWKERDDHVLTAKVRQAVQVAV